MNIFNISISQKSHRTIVVTNFVSQKSNIRLILKSHDRRWSQQDSYLGRFELNSLIGSLGMQQRHEKIIESDNYYTRIGQKGYRNR